MTSTYTPFVVDEHLFPWTRSIQQNCGQGTLPLNTRPSNNLLQESLLSTIPHSLRSDRFYSSTRCYADVVSGVDLSIPGDLDLTSKSQRFWHRSPTWKHGDVTDQWPTHDCDSSTTTPLESISWVPSMPLSRTELSPRPNMSIVGDEHGESSSSQCYFFREKSTKGIPESTGGPVVT